MNEKNSPHSTVKPKASAIPQTSFSSSQSQLERSPYLTHKETFLPSLLTGKNLYELDLLYNQAKLALEKLPEGSIKSLLIYQRQLIYELQMKIEALAPATPNFNREGFQKICQKLKLTPKETEFLELLFRRKTISTNQAINFMYPNSSHDFSRTIAVFKCRLRQKGIEILPLHRSPFYLSKETRDKLEEMLNDPDI